MGFCRGYSFNTGDLTTCGDVLPNYLEAYESVPWDDLRYMFGEVSGQRTCCAVCADACRSGLLACCCKP
jgi:hypothetical protein